MGPFCGGGSTKRAHAVGPAVVLESHLAEESSAPSLMPLRLEDLTTGTYDYAWVQKEKPKIASLHQPDRAATFAAHMPGWLRARVPQSRALPAEGPADQRITPSVLKQAPKWQLHSPFSLLPVKERCQAPLPVLLTKWVMVGLIVEVLGGGRKGCC